MAGLGGLSRGDRQQDEEQVEMFIGGAAVSTAANNKSKKGETKRLNADVPALIYQRLQVKAAQDGVKISQLVNRWINSYLE